MSTFVLVRRGAGLARAWASGAAVLSLALSAVAAETARKPLLNLVPWPAEVVPRDGHFALTERMTIAAEAAFAQEAAGLAKDLGLRQGGAAVAIKLQKAPNLPPEGYTLEVTPAGVTITASTPAGAFYGSQTLRQLVTHEAIPHPSSLIPHPSSRIPCVAIRDAPRTAWRGFMLDVSRHFFDKEEIKPVLDRMAALKLNVFHWHLTDDQGWRIEIKKYPKLTSVGAWRPARGRATNGPHVVSGRYGGFYTQNDIREIVAYAAARHIQVVPEIDMPGHMSAAAAAYPELSPANGWTPVVGNLEKGGRCAALCVARPNTVQFCQDVLTEVLELFPSKEIHIGGDEVVYGQWAPCPDMQALKEKLGAKDWADVQVDFTNKMVAFLAARGRTAVCWNNIYRQGVDKRCINQFWRTIAPARNFANAGYSVILSSKGYYYFSFRKIAPPEKIYEHDPLEIGATPAGQARIRGIEACIWTERVGSVRQLDAMLYPRLIAFAESAWTPQERKDWNTFQVRRESFERDHATPAEKELK